MYKDAKDEEEEEEEGEELTRRVGAEKERTAGRRRPCRSRYTPSREKKITEGWIF